MCSIEIAEAKICFLSYPLSLGKNKRAKKLKSERKLRENGKKYNANTGRNYLEFIN